MKLHEYQQRAIQFALRKKKSYMAVDLGLGKTAIALKCIQKLKQPTIVIAPLRVIYAVWPDEIKKWTPKLTYTILHGPYKNAQLEYNKDIYLLNYDGIKWFYNMVTRPGRQFKRCNLILDESTFVKSPTTKRFKLLKKLHPFFGDFKLALSATPAPNGYHDLWSQYYLLDQGVSLSNVYYKFRERFFWYSGPPRYQTILKRGAAKNIQTRIKPITFRLEGKDYLKLPEYIHNEIKLELPTKLKILYKTLEKDFVLNIQGTEIAAFNSAALSMKLRQFIQGGLYTEEGLTQYIHNIKLKALEELIESSNYQPVLCPVQFKFELKAIKKVFGNVPIIAGQTNAQQSIEYINEWNKGNIPLMLCHPASIGHGLNLQASGHIICWYGLTWSLEQYNQLIGRIYRQGQKKAVLVHHLIMKNTVDETVLSVLKKKDAVQSDLLLALKEVR
jgi:SNF2 family DNA or RNA helicase